MRKLFADIKRRPKLLGLLGLGLLFVASNLFTDYWLFHHQGQQFTHSAAMNNIAKVEQYIQNYQQHIAEVTSELSTHLESPTLNKQRFSELAQTLMASNPAILRVRFTSAQHPTWTTNRRSLSAPSFPPLISTPTDEAVQEGRALPIENNAQSTFDMVIPLVQIQPSKAQLRVTVSLETLLDEYIFDPQFQITVLDPKGAIIYPRHAARQNAIFNTNLANENDSQGQDTNGTVNETPWRATITLPNQETLSILLQPTTPFLLSQQHSFATSAFLSAFTGITLILITYVAWRILSRHINMLFSRHEISIDKQKAPQAQSAELLQDSQLFLDLASDGIHVMDIDGNIVVCSRSFAEMLGYQQQELIGMNVKRWDDKLSQQAWFNTINTLQDKPQHYQTRHKRKDGSVFDVNVTVQRIDNHSGHYFYASSRHISHRKALEQPQGHVASFVALPHILTRTEFIRRFSQELDRFGHHSSAPITFAMLDLDDLENINHQYGHDAGNVVLDRVANIITTSLRKNDFVGRLGGEELGMVYVGATSDFALDFTERMRKRIHNAVILHHQQRIRCTVSIGLTDVHYSDRNVGDVIERADQALYLAKALGKDRVEAY